MFAFADMTAYNAAHDALWASVRRALGYGSAHLDGKPIM
jgi:hypothetical protein